MINKLDKWLDQFSFLLVLICVAGMLGLTVLNILLRWFNTTYMWIDPMVRHLVFATAFLGGVLATGRDNHIRIDLIGKFLEKIDRPVLSRWINRIVYLVAMLATLLLAIAGFNFMEIELEYGKIAFLGIHSGFLVGIIPFGLGMIFLRYLLRFLLSFQLQDRKIDE